MGYSLVANCGSSGFESEELYLRKNEDADILDGMFQFVFIAEIVLVI